MRPAVSPRGRQTKDRVPSRTRVTAFPKAGTLRISQFEDKKQVPRILDLPRPLALTVLQRPRNWHSVTKDS